MNVISIKKIWLKLEIFTLSENRIVHSSSKHYTIIVAKPKILIFLVIIIFFVKYCWTFLFLYFLSYLSHTLWNKIYLEPNFEAKKVLGSFFYYMFLKKLNYSNRILCIYLVFFKISFSSSWLTKIKYLYK